VATKGVRAVEESPIKQSVSPEKMPQLLEMVQKLYSSLNLDDVLKNILFLSQQLVNAEGGSVTLIDRKTRKLTIARAVSLDEELIRRTSLNIGERVAGWVVAQKTPVIIQGDAKDNPTFAHITDYRRGIRSSMSIPLKVNETVVGVVNLNRMLDGDLPEFNDGDLRLAVTFAGYCASALQNARLCETLLAQNEQLMMSDKTMSGAVTKLCREMDTPLSLVVGCISNLLGGTLGEVNEKQKQNLQNALQQCNAVLNLLEQMKSASERKTTKEAISPKRLIENSISGGVKEFYEEKRIRLSYDIPEDLPEVIANRGKIEQVLINFLVNACKYSESGSKTVVLAREKDGEVEFCVSDTGKGIPQDHLQKIFEEFHRVEPERPEPGIGLGLAISKKIIESHGGKIWAESKPGVGSKFFFTLPTRKKIENE
jgi:K+-sensing histidine kinase KdpD